MTDNVTYHNPQLKMQSNLTTLSISMSPVFLSVEDHPSLETARLCNTIHFFWGGGRGDGALA